MTHPTALLPLALLVAAALAGPVAAQTPAEDFKQSCSSCHTIGGGPLTGPDLKDVTERKDRAWLRRFIVDPAGVLASGDPYAQKLLAEAGGVAMPPVAGMTEERADALLDLIEGESAKKRSRFAGSTVPDRPLTDADIAHGRAVFVGTTPLENGGPSCVSCHATGDVGGLGGGRLGPDLTKVFERHRDRKRLAAWLSAPATPTMLPTYRNHPLSERDILGLVAYFRSTAAGNEEDDAPRVLVFVLLGLAGTAGLLAVFNNVWKGRFRGVRRALVEDGHQGGTA